MWSLGSTSLDQGLANFSYKGPLINTLGFVGLYTCMVSCIFFFVFNKSFKNVKFILSSRAVQGPHSQWTWICPIALSLQTPSIDCKKLTVTYSVNTTQLSKAVISNLPESAGWNVHYNQGPAAIRQTTRGLNSSLLFIHMLPLEWQEHLTVICMSF